MRRHWRPTDSILLLLACLVAIIWVGAGLLIASILYPGILLVWGVGRLLKGTQMPLGEFTQRWFHLEWAF